MKLTITVRLAVDRVSAILDDGTVMYEDVGVVVLEDSGSGPELIAGIGSSALALGRDRVLPALSIDAFRPAVSAGVVARAAMVAWSRKRPRFHGLGAAFDRVDVIVEVSDFDRLPAQMQEAFTKGLPYHPQITWWVLGKKVSY